MEKANVNPAVKGEPEYLQRMREESRLLGEKLSAIAFFMAAKDSKYGKFDTADQTLFDMQRKYMIKYKKCLDARIAHDELKERAAKPAPAARPSTRPCRTVTLADLADMFADTIADESPDDVTIFYYGL